MKQCTNCGIWWSPEFFYRNSAAPDGRAWRCIECAKKIARERLGPRPPDWKKKSADKKAYRKKWLDEHPGYLSKMKKKYYSENRDKLKVRYRFREALKRGKLERQPCFVCGIESADGHHPDYSRPLDVVWLCKDHHRQLHREAKWFML